MINWTLRTRLATQREYSTIAGSRTSGMRHARSQASGDAARREAGATTINACVLIAATE